jgi:hypothetical protein
MGISWSGSRFTLGHVESIKHFLNEGGRANVDFPVLSVSFNFHSNETISRKRPYFKVFEEKGVNIGYRLFVVAAQESVVDPNHQN